MTAPAPDVALDVQGLVKRYGGRAVVDELSFSVRTGTGVLMDNDHAALTLAPDGTAYVATLAGMVRVQDRQPKDASD